MTIQANIRTFLINDPSISALVDDRIYPMLLPQKPIYPAISYQWVSVRRSWNFNSAVGIATPRVQFDCWGNTYSEMVQLAEALRIVLDGMRGTMPGTPPSVIQGIFLESERDLYEDIEQGEGDGEGVFRRSMDYFINYEEVFNGN